MISRQLGKLIASILLIAALPFSMVDAKAKLSKSASADDVKLKDVEFQKDLESLLGASIKTKHGQMSLRQSKDRFGRVRKQILTGPDFSELQLDQNGDGTVDYWSVTQGKKSVVVSEPNRGRFLRLDITERTSRGMVESTYLLNINGRSYSHLKTRFMGNDVRFADKSVEFQPTEVMERHDESARIQRILDSGGGEVEIPVSTVPLVNDERFSLVEGDWTNQQTIVFGDELSCMANDNGYGRLASLQRDWWKILKFEVEEKSDRLTEKLKASKMFADNCKDPKNEKEFERIAESIAQVMLSSPKGEAWTSTTSRGRYLRCLEQSGLGITAAEIERGFLDTINGSYRSYSPITCEIKAPGVGLSTPAEAFPARQQVAVYMNAADEGRMVDELDKSVANYPNVIFHELIHVTGLKDEGIAHAAQACCGEPSQARGAACNKLDLLVAKAARAKTIETFLSRVSGELTPLKAQLESTFGADDANKIYASFLEGVDNFKKGSPPQGTYVDGLLSSAQFSKCAAVSGAEVCRTQWTKEIQSYADTFFAKQCKLVASGANRRNCSSMPSTFKDSLAQTIASSLIDTSTASGGQCIAKTSAILESSSSIFAATVERIVDSLFGPIARAADENECPKMDVPTSPVFTPIACPNNECGPRSDTTTNVDGQEAPGKTISVPGESNAGNAAGTDDRPTGSAGRGGGGASGGGGYSGGSGGGRVTRSPLPVQQVDTVSASRPFTEDQYRRATDFVGSATRQFDKVRDSILPRAEASDRDARSSAKLGLKDNFVAFRPGESRAVQTAIDNPFSEKRTIASISDISNVQSKALSGTDRAAGLALAAGSRGSGRAAGEGAKDPVSKSSTASTNRSGNGGASGVSTSQSQSSRSTASLNDGGKNGAGHATTTDVLEGLFKLPYREVEHRLNRLEVAEALIAAKISVQDAAGRKLGSNRANERYIFAGFDRPLKRIKE